MQLNQEQRNNLIRRLNELWQPPKNCSVCGRNEWEVSDNVFEIREFSGGGMVIGGQSQIIPVIPVVCKNCGNILFFNAIKLEIIPRQNDGR